MFNAVCYFQCMTDKPGRTAPARTFVVRVVVGEQTVVHGQASEPGSADEWHVTASSLAELWDRLEQRLAVVVDGRITGGPGSSK